MGYCLPSGIATPVQRDVGTLLNQRNHVQNLRAQESEPREWSLPVNTLLGILPACGTPKEAQTLQFMFTQLSLKGGRVLGL